MTITEACAAIEKVIESMSIVQSFQVRPSGDDVDAIKIWVDLGDTKLDTAAWATKLAADLARLVPGAAPYRLDVHAEAGL